MHVHVRSANGYAKFWLEPTSNWQRITVCDPPTMASVQELIEEYEDEIKAKWKAHFSR